MCFCTEKNAQCCNIHLDIFILILGIFTVLLHLMPDKVKQNLSMSYNEQRYVLMLLNSTFHLYEKECVVAFFKHYSSQL